MTFNCTTPEDVLQERSWPFAILCTVLFTTSTLLLAHVGLLWFPASHRRCGGLGNVVDPGRAT